MRYEKDGIVPHKERYIDALKKFGIMYGTTRAFAVDHELMSWDHKLVNLIESTLCQVCCLLAYESILIEQVMQRNY